jgi:ribonuclease P protein component
VRDRADGDEALRVGFTVTKKIGGAVVRNRMKRRLRALARELLPAGGMPGADHVLIGRNGGKRTTTPGFILLVRDRKDADPAMRVGFTVTKKIGGAVVRNRMKRRFRALAREIVPAKGLAGSDHVMIGRAKGVERDFGLLRSDLERALDGLHRQ